MSSPDHDVKQHAIQRLLANNGIYSQAQNFLGVVSSAVDPRTGQFMLAINLPTLIGNNLSGPTLTPMLSYNAQSSLQNKGFGLGWSLLLSEIVWSATSSSLRLSSGEQFAIDRQKSDPSIGGTLVFFDHKLNDLLVTRLSDDSFRIDRKTGEVEILTRQHSNSANYYLSEMRTAEGRRLSLSWLLAAPDTYRLSRITDETGRTLLAVETRTGFVDFVTDPDVPNSPVPIPEAPSRAQPNTLTLQLANDRVSKVRLTNMEGAFEIGYLSLSVGNGVSLWFPSSFSGPLGASDTISWTSDASAGHQLPEDAPLTHLPRVILWRQTHGSPDKVLTHEYRWTGQTNFLGFGSEQGFDWQDGRDNLYWAEHAYWYRSTETQRHGDVVLSTLKRTWNNFHLPVETVTTSGDTEITTCTTYGINDKVGWEGQPAYCQLPHEVITTYRDKKAGTERSEHSSYTYDNSGNILTAKYPTGVEETSTYYSADNSTNGCPPDALAKRLGIVRFLERKTTTPAPTDFAAPVLSTTYEYEDLESLAPEEHAQPHAVVVKETTINETDGTVLEVTEQTYDKTQTSEHYGRELTATTTINGKATTTLFEYTLANEQLTTQVTVKGHDISTRPVSLSATSSCRSTLTGQIEHEISAAGVITTYEYDVLGRLNKTSIAQGTSYEASRTARYYVNDEEFIAIHRPEGITARVATEEADASGQWRRTWLDGAGRPVCVELQDVDIAPVQFREVSRTLYDPLGRVDTHTIKEWFEGKKLFKLTTQTQHDDWGNVRSVSSPSGVVTHTLVDPVNLSSEQWQEGSAGKCSGRHIVHSNVAGSPIKREWFDENAALTRTMELIRDGMDRVMTQSIKVTGHPDIVTHYRYDAYSRVIEQTRPDDTRIDCKYAAHSDGEHPESIEVTAAG